MKSARKLPHRIPKRRRPQMKINITKQSFFDRLTQFIKDRNYQRLPYDIWKKIYDRIYGDNLIITKNNAELYKIAISFGSQLSQNIVTICNQPMDEVITISNSNYIGSYVLYEFCKMLETQNIAKEVINPAKPIPITAESKYVNGSVLLDKLIDYCDETHYEYADETRLFQQIKKDKQYKIVEIQERFVRLIEVGSSKTLLDNSCTSVIENFTWWHTFFHQFFKEPLWITQNKNINTNNTRKETEEMKGFNIEFGSCENDNVRLSMYGLAVKNPNGEWVSYDAKNDTIINVDIFNFEGGKYLYKMPVALGDIKPGDLLIHNRKPVFVTDVTDGVKAVDIAAGEKKEVMLTRNMFNYEFATKVVSLLDFMGGAAATKEQPFGNMLPLLMLEQGGDTSDLMPLMLMQGKMDFSNPMMMYFLMKDKKDNMVPLFFMMNGVTKNECNKEN